MAWTKENYVAWLVRQARPVLKPAAPYDGPEGDLHDQIVDYCAKQWPPWIALHSAMYRPTTRNEGEWDFTIVASEGRVFFIEVKRKGGKVSDEQQALIARARDLKHAVHVVYSFAEFMNAVKENPRQI